MSRFTEITSSVSKSYLKNGSWNAFGSSFSDTSFDGIKLQTGSLNFYLRYRTCNKTYGWYPYVTSKVNDYAGSSGKAAEAVQIQVYNNSGTRIDKGFIIMYRAYAEYRWLDWVSNASPERMQMIQNQFGLDGTLDLTGSNSGLPGDGIPLSRFEIRIFEEDLSVDPGDIPASVTNGVSQSYMVNDVWNALTSSASSVMHGIRIQTENKPYYLKYRTYNTGYGWYSYVKSNDTSASAYAGSSGKAIEGVQIQVCDNSGTKLSGTFVVMYRVFADGKWLSWVSNAPYDIMQSLQTAANLGGTLDGDSSNAGYTGTGKAITQMDIRVFEYVKAPSNDYPTATGEFSQSYRSGGTWSVLTASSSVSSMDGVKLTTNNSAYYLKYRTFSTQTDWLPYVTSTSKDYAGSSGKAVEAVQIQVYDSNNLKLDKTYVVMYRAYANGAWLDWVSNASPEKMREIIDRDKLSGGVDTAGAYAGTKGTPLNKLEIRFYPNESTTVPAEPAIENLTMSYMVGSSSTWTTFENSVTAAQMDGIKIRTSANKSYYLQYRTFNAGKTDWYSYVKSTINDYAGAAGKAIQRLQIQAYKNDGTKLSSGVIVMYRAYVNGAWLSWVSNANKASMEYVQNKYNLGGSLDTAGSYAGISGKNIGGIEIRVFEETVPVSDSTETTIRTKETGGNGMKIYIDPGHGGSDSGACNGNCLEKNYNLRIAMALKKYLSEMGFNVKLSREIDIYQSLDDRTNDANNWGAELFISIHNNAKENTATRGLETYYSQLKNDDSRKYAVAIYEKLSTLITPHYFGVRVDADGDYYHVIRESHMKAMLVECAHISNAEDLLFLNNLHNLVTIAQLIAQAVYDTVEVKPVPPVVQPTIPDDTVYTFGAVQNKKTMEIYPLYVNPSETVIDLPYEQEIDLKNEKPTDLSYLNFDGATLISGLSFEEAKKEQITAGDFDLIETIPNTDKSFGMACGVFFAGCLRDAINSVSKTYLQVRYYKESSQGKKRAICYCGNQDYYQYIFNLSDMTIGLKSLFNYGSDIISIIEWRKDVNKYVSEIYSDITRNSIDDNYEYDMIFEFDEQRKNSLYTSQLWVDKNGDVYEKPIRYGGDHVYIRVSNGLTEIDKVDIINNLSFSRKVSPKIQQAFNIRINP